MSGWQGGNSDTKRPLTSYSRVSLTALDRITFLLLHRIKQPTLAKWPWLLLVPSLGQSVRQIDNEWRGLLENRATAFRHPKHTEWDVDDVVVKSSPGSCPWYMTTRRFIFHLRHRSRLGEEWLVAREPRHSVIVVLYLDSSRWEVYWLPASRSSVFKKV